MSAWPTLRLGEICEPKTGVRDPRRHPDKVFRYVDISSVDNKAKKITSASLTLGSEAPSRARQVLRANDVLVSMTRPNLNAVALVPPELNDEICSTGFSVLRATHRVLPAYLFHFVRTPAFVQATTAAVSGALYPAITSSFLRSLPIPLPPLEEQGRIVGLLDRAADIRRRADAARAKARAIIPALFLDMFGDPLINAKGWPSEALGKHISLIGGGTPSKTKSEFWNGNIPWVSPKDMKPPAIVDSEDKITDSAMASCAVRLIPSGNVLIVVRGMILAHTVPIRMNSVAVTVNQDMKALLPRSQLNATFLRWMLQVAHGYLLEKVRESAHGTKKLETPTLTAFPTILPPLSMQRSFEQQVQRIEGISSVLDAAAHKAKAMSAALSAEVFT